MMLIFPQKMLWPQGRESLFVAETGRKPVASLKSHAGRRFSCALRICPPELPVYGK
jgi:hypothetical protein